MPYLSQNDREDFLPDWDGPIYPHPETSGELNFVLSTILANYIAHNGLRYSKIADVLSAVEGAKFEFLRRVVDPYEEIKMRENGDLDPYIDVMELLSKERAKNV